MPLGGRKSIKFACIFSKSSCATGLHNTVANTPDRQTERWTDTENCGPHRNVCSRILFRWTTYLERIANARRCEEAAYKPIKHYLKGQTASNNAFEFALDVLREHVVKVYLLPGNGHKNF